MRGPGRTGMRQHTGEDFSSPSNCFATPTTSCRCHPKETKAARTCSRSVSMAPDSRAERTGVKLPRTLQCGALEFHAASCLVARFLDGQRQELVAGGHA